MGWVRYPSSSEKKEAERCTRSGKICHLSYRHAAGYLKSLGDITRRWSKHKGGFRPYFCKWCSHWHLGSSK